MKIFILLTFLTMAFTVYADLDPRFYVGNKNTFRQAIEKNKITLEDWIEKINSEKINFLCLGESHKDEFRFLMADNIFNKFFISKLFLEADDDVAVELLKKIDAGEERVEMLMYADIAKLVRSAKSGNPDIQIFGVDENSSQEAETKKINDELGQKVASRDSFIAQNIYQKLNENELSVALYGSSHCARNDIGLGRTTFWHLLGTVFEEKNLKAKNVLFIHSGDYGQFDLEMMLLGQKAPFVIHDTNLIDPKVFGHRWELMKVFSNYDVIVYF